MPTSPPLRCGRCQAALRGAVFNLPGPAKCPECGARNLVQVFPAFFRNDPPAIAQRVPSNSVCAIHPARAAVAVCSRCGQPACALCETDIDGRKFCPLCANEPGHEGELGALQTETVVYDRLALLLGAWPLVLILTLWPFWPIYLVSAAATFYVVIRFWEAPPRAFIPRPQGHMILAAALACLQLVIAAVFAWLTVLWFHHLRS